MPRRRCLRWMRVHCIEGAAAVFEEDDSAEYAASKRIKILQLCHPERSGKFAKRSSRAVKGPLPQTDSLVLRLLRPIDIRCGAEENLRRFHNGFRHRRMRMNRKREISRGRGHLDCENAFSNQFSRACSDNAHA